MRILNEIGAIICRIGIGLYWAMGIWAVIVNLGVIYDALGILGVLIQLLLVPTILLVPIYAGFWLGDWFPALITYGGMVPPALVCLLGSALGAHKTEHFR